MGFERSQMFLTAFVLRIFTKLKRPETSKNLSLVVELNPEITVCLLNVLTVMKLLCKRGEHFQIDLGGEHGLLASGFAQKNPNLEVIMHDRPEIIDLTRDYIEKKGGEDSLPEGCRFFKFRRDFYFSAFYSGRF
jgi:hypothetical protein